MVNVLNAKSNGAEKDEAWSWKRNAADAEGSVGAQGVAKAHQGLPELSDFEDAESSSVSRAKL